jgi:uncharacterized protein YajQ (UPF0234 family)
MGFKAKDIEWREKVLSVKTNIRHAGGIVAQDDHMTKGISAKTRREWNGIVRDTNLLG